MGVGPKEIYIVYTMAIWVVEFLNGGTKLERFLPKKKKKLLNFKNWVNGEVSKVPKFDFQSQFSMSKIVRIFLIFFPLKTINLGAYFLLLTFFDNINF